MRRSLPIQAAVVEDVNLHAPRGLDRALFQKLATCEWVRDHHHLVVVGPTGHREQVVVGLRPRPQSLVWRFRCQGAGAGLPDIILWTEGLACHWGRSLAPRPCIRLGANRTMKQSFASRARLRAGGAHSADGVIARLCAGFTATSDQRRQACRVSATRCRREIKSPLRSLEPDGSRCRSQRDAGRDLAERHHAPGAISSFRASATIIFVLRAPCAVRAWYHCASPLSFWNLRNRQASWIGPRRMPGRCQLWPAPFPAVSIRSRRVRRSARRKRAHRTAVSQVAAEHLLDQHVSRLDPDPDHAGQERHHRLWPRCRCLLQPSEAGLLDRLRPGSRTRASRVMSRRISSSMFGGSGTALRRA